MQIFNDVHYALAKGLCFDTEYPDPRLIYNQDKCARMPKSISSLKDAGFIVFPLERRYSEGLIKAAIEAMRQGGFDASQEDARRVIGASTGWVIEHWYPDMLSPPDV